MIGRQEQMFPCSRVLLYLTTLLLFRSSEAQSCAGATQSCDVCSSLCNGITNQINVFQNSSVQPLTCPPPVGGGGFDTVRWYHRTSSGPQGTLIDKSNSRYGGGRPETLIINNVVPGDEGLYRCEYTLTGGTQGQADVGCVFVKGRAAFTSCTSQTCSEDITVYTGQNIIFDTRIMFSNSGDCGIPQDTNSVRLFSGTRVSQTNLLYVCSNTNSPCPETYMTSTIHAVNSGGHKFSLNLTLPNAALEDGGTYTAEVEVRRPTGGLTTLRKTFRVTVNSPPPTTPPPTTPPTTPSPTTPSLTTPPPSGMVPTDPTSTTPTQPMSQTNIQGGSTGPTSPSSTVPTATSSSTSTTQPQTAFETITRIVVPVVSVIAIVAICGAVICVVAVYRRRSKCSCACSDLESVKPSTNEHEKSPSHHFTMTKHIVEDYRHATTQFVCSSRPESTCVPDIGDFELPDHNTIQDDGNERRQMKMNSEHKPV